MSTASLLRSKTADLHLATESVMQVGSIRSASLSLEAYTRMMVLHFRVWSAVAAALPPASRPGYLAFVGGMLVAIRADLETLGKSLPPPLDYSPFSDTAAALYGVAYVLRGSTLGAKMINRNLRNCPALSHLSSFNFHAACEALPSPHWPGFLKELEANVDDEAGREQALDAARAVFGLYLV